ncbi:MAG: peptidylprolyl isomerase [Clostridium sp.]|nr:peptidylprolyl isomerase [Clostridium sp.]
MLKKILRVFLFTMIFLTFVGCGKEKKVQNANHYVDYKNIDIEQLKRPEIGEDIAIIKTNYGEIKLRLFEDIAPKAVENFKTLVNEGFYTGHAFTNMGQVSVGIGKIGEPEYDGKSIYGDGFDIEVDHNYSMLYGSVVIPRRVNIEGKNYSNFAIIDRNYLSDEELEEISTLGFSDKEIDAFKSIGGNIKNKDEITVFGQVYYGMDTIEKMREVKVGAMNEPLTIIEISSIELAKYEGDI